MRPIAQRILCVSKFISAYPLSTSQRSGSQLTSQVCQAFCGRCVLIFLLFPVCLFTLSGCASVSVKNTRRGSEPVAKPSVIYVADFDTESGTWRVDRTGDELARLKVKVKEQLANDLVKRLEKKVAHAVKLPSGSGSTLPLPDSGWLLTGRLTRVNQGSRALRMVVGLGAGGTKLETEMEIRDLSQPGRPVILSTVTTGGTNAEPGAMFSLTSTAVTMPLQVAGGLLGKSSGGLSRDAIRTSRMIVAVMSQFGVSQGWIKPQDGMRPKELGSLPVPTSDRVLP